MNGTGRSLGRTLAAAFPHTVPVLTGYLVLGMAYGVLMQAKGYGAIWAFLMSAVAFCGSMQFVAITLLTGAFDPVGAFLMSLMVNARHLFYGVSMLGKYRGMGWAKVPLVYTLSDETFSIVSSVEPPEGMRAGTFTWRCRFWTISTGWAARCWGPWRGSSSDLTPRGWTSR